MLHPTDHTALPLSDDQLHAQRRHLPAHQRTLMDTLDTILGLGDATTTLLFAYAEDGIPEALSQLDSAWVIEVPMLPPHYEHRWTVAAWNDYCHGLHSADPAPLPLPVPALPGCPPPARHLVPYAMPLLAPEGHAVASSERGTRPWVACHHVTRIWLALVRAALSVSVLCSSPCRQSG